jgi:D-alanine transaminase
MARIAYVNGSYLPLADAAVSIEDRGYQFADGVYEVCAVLNGWLVDWPQHLTRLARSLGELSIPVPMTDAALSLVVGNLLRVNRATDALLYVQVTRGVSRRDHPFPDQVRPALVMTVRPHDFRRLVTRQGSGISIVTAKDQRWARRDIKSVGLLPNVLAKQAARSSGAFEAWLVGPDGIINEGTSSNAWIVSQEGVLVTPPKGPDILAGVVRDTLLRLAREHQMPVEERTFTVAEAKGAAEAWMTSTGTICLGITSIDGQLIGNGTPGPITRRVYNLLWDEIARQTGWRAT